MQEFIYQAVPLFSYRPWPWTAVDWKVEIEKKRREEASSLWEHKAESITTNETMEFYHNPQKNLFYRRPGRIASAGKLGLGVADLKRIDHGKIRLG